MLTVVPAVSPREEGLIRYEVGLAPTLIVDIVALLL
jgi:hypothetical protein